MMRWRRITRFKIIYTVIGKFIGLYLKFVGLTNRIQSTPEDFYEHIGDNMPIIVTMWHGEHFMLPFARRKDHRVTVLISKSNDGEINATAAEMLGMEVVRGSGGRQQTKRYRERGGAKGLLTMLRLLEDGISVSMTADIPRGKSRKVSDGMMTLARLSGRPILPIGFASTRYKRLDTWDRSVVTLPFGRGHFVAGKLLWVDKNADADELDKKKRALEDSLNNAYARAYEKVEKKQ